jgi:hypothetical protein
VAARIKLDMHMHTQYSRDSRSSLEAFARRAIETGLGAVCVTDHDTAAGGLRLAKMDVPFTVVPGEEVTTRDGEIVGLFLERDVPRGLAAEETAKRIRDQGGLVYIPHPFSRNRLRHLRRPALDRLVEQELVDAVEIFNAREITAASNAHAVAFAVQHGLPGGVGSDAHRLAEIGRAYIEVADFATPSELLAALREGTIVGKLSGAVVHLRTWSDIARKVGRRAASGLRLGMAPRRRP